ncbi:pentapeptide repeat-containing protein [Methylocapsa palsarum]|uniref:Uncharacterized protein YjbI, contains pentapeptide repeats n=1 Tax=Methylocapsa palsarum TaxID=1612308 RepID=A0A1I4A1N9_9HYPH|nr:pentapeptide repeat-containing protein [Methylocapsa palsarum]SFK50294.1 Uncharacterized protein YjbI, contains pentapeptide repeats [Methylocapsa palsarum]
MLAAKAGAYDKALRDELGDADDKRNAERRRLPSNIFVQFLAGPKEIRNGGLGLILKAIAWISLVIAPVLLLLLIQAQFLPYHLEWVTWVQRFALVADLLLLWALWPAVLDGRGSVEWPKLWRPGAFVLALASLIPIGLAIAARFPGEWLDQRIGDRRWIPANGFTAWLGATGAWGEPIPTSFHNLLFNGAIDDVTRRRKSPFSTTLVLPGFDLLEAEKIEDDKKLSWAKHTFSLRGRRLEGARFDFADLRKADLTGAYLDRASLDRAQLQGASLEGAQLQGASLDYTQLQGVSLEGAQLQGASLFLAQLQGASLRAAQLQGASLIKTQLQGASLFLAQLQGALLGEAKLQGASLDSAQLPGASLQAAQLQGATLYLAELQGASLDYAQLQGAIMQDASVWRADARNAVAPETVVLSPFSERDAQSFDDRRQFMMQTIPAGEKRDDALARIEKRLKPDSFPDEKAIADDWTKKEKHSAAPAAVLAAWKTIGCRANDPKEDYLGAPYVARALLRRLDEFANEKAAKAKLVAAFLSCPGAKGLTEDEIAKLNAIAGSPPPPPPASKPKP